MYKSTFQIMNFLLISYLIFSFNELVQGIYPLALPEDEGYKPAISKREMEEAAQRLLQFEEADLGETVRKTKKQRRRDARKLQQLEQQDDTIGSEDGSVFLNDSDFLGRIDDNYSSYVSEQMHKSAAGVSDTVDFAESTSQTKKKLKKRKQIKQKEQDEDEEDDESRNFGFHVTSQSTDQEPTKKKKKYKTVVEFEADELHEELSVTIDSPNKKLKSKKQETLNEDTVINILPKKKRKSLILGSGKVLISGVRGSNDDQHDNDSDDYVKIAKRKCKSLSPSKSTSLGLALAGKSVDHSMLTPIRNNDILRKKLKLRGTPESEGSKKRINFVLNRNLEHGKYVLCVPDLKLHFTNLYNSCLFFFQRRPITCPPFLKAQQFPLMLLKLQLQGF